MKGRAEKTSNPAKNVPARQSAESAQSTAAAASGTIGAQRCEGVLRGRRCRRRATVGHTITAAGSKWPLALVHEFMLCERCDKLADSLVQRIDEVLRGAPANG